MESISRERSLRLLRLGLAMLTLAVTFVSSALAAPEAKETGRKTPAQRAEAIVSELKTQLALDQSQETQLLAIYKEFYEKMVVLRAAGSDESKEARDKLRAERQQLLTEFKAKLATVLTPAQMEQYSKLQEKRHEEGRKMWQGQGEEKAK